MAPLLHTVNALPRSCWQQGRNVEEADRPGGSDHPGQQPPLLLHGELHDARGLKLLPDPPTLLQVVDEHELYPDVLTVRRLKATRSNIRRNVILPVSTKNSVFFLILLPLGAV